MTQQTTTFSRTDCKHYQSATVFLCSTCKLTGGYCTNSKVECDNFKSINNYKHIKTWKASEPINQFSKLEDYIIKAVSGKMFKVQNTKWIVQNNLEGYQEIAYILAKFDKDRKNTVLQVYIRDGGSTSYDPNDFVGLGDEIESAISTFNSFKRKR